MRDFLRMPARNLSTVVVGLTLLWPPAPSAQEPPQAMFEEHAREVCENHMFTGTDDFSPESAAVRGQIGGGSVCQATSSVILSGGPAPSINLQAEAVSTNFPTLLEASGRLTYYTRIDCPGAPFGTRVPVRVRAAVTLAGSVSSESRGSAFAQVSIPFGRTVAGCTWWNNQPFLCSSGPEGGFSDSIDEVRMLPANQDISTSMVAFIGRSGGTQTGGGGTGTQTVSIQAIADPTMEFEDPADAAACTMQHSPNQNAVDLGPGRPLVSQPTYLSSGTLG